jgi:hypothetical protein
MLQVEASMRNTRRQTLFLLLQQAYLLEEEEAIPAMGAACSLEEEGAPHQRLEGEATSPQQLEGEGEGEEIAEEMLEEAGAIILQDCEELKHSQEQLGSARSIQ